jgi:hypothetical protein
MATSCEKAEDWKHFYFWGISANKPSALSFPVEQLQALLGAVKADCAITSLAALDPRHLINHKGTTAWILLFVHALMNDKEGLAAVANGRSGLFTSAATVHGAFGSHVNWPESLLRKYEFDFGERWPFVIPFIRHREASAPMQMVQSLRSPDGALEVMGVAEFSEQEPEALLALFHAFYQEHGEDFKRPSLVGGTKFDSYTPVLQSLVAEAIKCSPAIWDKGQLAITCDGAYLNYALKNSESEDKAQISDTLRRLCEDFYVLMRQAGDTWDKAVVEYFRKDGSWSFDVNFEREEAVTQRHTAASTLANAAKPWWKFWQ